MDLNLDDDERLLVESADRWLSGSYSWATRQASVAAGGCDSEVWRELADLGWLGLATPESAGGLGLALQKSVLFMAALGRGLLVEPLVATAVVGNHVLASAPGNSIAATLIEEVVAGEAKVVTASAERGVAGGPSVRLRSTGDRLALDGSLRAVADGGAADWFIVAAEQDEKGEAALVLVRRDTAGMSVPAYQLIDGRSAVDLVFDGCEVSSDAVLLSGAAAEQVLDEALDRGLAASLGELVGGMEACLELSIGHLKERRQFGQPLGKFQALQHLAADIFVDCSQARSMLYFLMSKLENGRPAPSISQAKLLIGDAAQRVATRAMQIHGAIAFTDEFIVGHYYKRALVLAKLYGDDDFHHRRAVELEPSPDIVVAAGEAPVGERVPCSI